MQIGEVIRKYRKEKEFTQEEMARRLGVTAPAVNKWEKGASLPDITLLAPIARLLDISLDTLLSFREGLTAKEIKNIVWEADERLQRENYEEVFQWAKKLIEQYPNCEQLIWQLAVILDAQRPDKHVPDGEKYDQFLCDCYVRVLGSKDEEIQRQAADSLFNFYMRKGRYKQAAEYLQYFSRQNPQRKLMQGQLYHKTKRLSEAYKEYEELLFNMYSVINGAFREIHMLVMEEKNMDKMRLLVEKEQKLAELFDMGLYHENSPKLEMALLEKNGDKVLETMENMLAGFDTIYNFVRSPLYEHMTFQPIREEFLVEMRKELINGFRDEETYGFLKGDERWESLVKKYE